MLVCLYSLSLLSTPSIISLGKRLMGNFLETEIFSATAAKAGRSGGRTQKTNECEREKNLSYSRPHPSSIGLLVIGPGFGPSREDKVGAGASTLVLECIGYSPLSTRPPTHP